MGNLCKCGCGKEVKNNFIRGHNSKGENNINYGKKFSIEYRERIAMGTKKAMEQPEVRTKLSLAKKGKCYEEIMGVEMAKLKRERNSERMRGEKHFFYGKNLSEDHRNKLSLAHLGQISWCKGTTGLTWNAGKPLSNEHRSRISLGVKGKPSSMKGKNHTEETKTKIRIKIIKRIQDNYNIIPQPFYNIKACEYFKKFDEENNTKGRYAVYGGGEFQIKELGYFPDYINFEKKLIIEWDEEKHYKSDGSLREKDVIRQKQIQEFYPDFEFRGIKQKEVAYG